MIKFVKDTSSDIGARVRNSNKWTSFINKGDISEEMYKYL